MGFGTIFTILTFILIFAGMIIVVVTVQQALGDSVREVKEQQSAQRRNDQQEISISSASYSVSALVPWKTTYAAEFSAGNLTNTSVVGDSVELSAGASQGYLESVPYDTGSAANYTTLSWTSIEPAGSAVDFQARTAGSLAALGAATYVGPDGTVGTSYTSPGTLINETHDGDQYIQWRANLTTVTSTPELLDVSLGVRRDAGATTVEIENTGKTKLSFEETDAYIDGVRVLRDPSERTIESPTTGDPRLWNPGELFNLTVFGNHSVAFSLSVANEFAQDATTVTP